MLGCGLFCSVLYVGLLPFTLPSLLTGGSTHELMTLVGSGDEEERVPEWQSGYTTDLGMLKGKTSSVTLPVPRVYGTRRATL